jgi:hypothetical protein
LPTATVRGTEKSTVGALDASAAAAVAVDAASGVADVAVGAAAGAAVLGGAAFTNGVGGSGSR